ncbi:MAG: zinc ABC transporter substrate-binding protein, partial [Bacilli bacterium]|nr:zinc ABC transporter substrate-binding protein [Bacilli bacterium]
MIKKILSIFSLGAIIIALTGCDFKTNSMDDITIYTTNYASEYIVKRLYGDHSSIYSIYPNGVNISNYKLTSKQIKDYSNSDLYIFNGLNSNEKNYVSKMRENNKKIKIIDDTLSMAYINGMEELWLDPSNFLMIAQNYNNGIAEYIDNYYLKNASTNNYEELKIEAS